MIKKILISLFLLLFVLLVPKETYAINNPNSTENNIYGVHVADLSQLNDVSKLVNSNGGDWGYVTFVIQKGERDPKRWQEAFNVMRRLHLIPIVRIASAPVAGNSNVWEIPNTGEIDGWVSFLNSLNWVIENRYVIVGNEPNHASEWGGIVDPAGYADYLKMFSQKLKAANPNFFILPAGMDASATTINYPIGASTMDESLYLEKMVEHDPHVFDDVDGWSSHSYPNPNFSGPGEASGKGTVKTYAWELDYLKFLGIEKNFPVFITETGWTHGTDSLTTDIGSKIETAFKGAWSDKRIAAVTPFIFNYSQPPFDTFSWVNKNGEYYDFYYNVLNLAKISGKPIQEVKGEVLTGVMPSIATTNSLYHAVIFVKNTGQSIWRTKDLGATDILGDKLTIQSMFPENNEPGQIAVFLITGNFPSISGSYEESITLTSNGKAISNSFDEQVILIPKLPSLIDVWNYLKIVIARKIGR